MGLWVHSWLGLTVKILDSELCFLLLWCIGLVTLQARESRALLLRVWSTASALPGSLLEMQIRRSHSSLWNQQLLGWGNLCLNKPYKPYKWFWWILCLKAIGLERSDFLKVDRALHLSWENLVWAQYCPLMLWMTKFNSCNLCGRAGSGAKHQHPDLSSCRPTWWLEWAALSLWDCFLPNKILSKSSENGSS